MLAAHRWPGNVRELRNAIEHAVTLSSGGEIVADDLPSRIRACERPAPSDDLLSMDEVERRHVLRVLDAVAGNKSEAVRILGWNRKTLYRRLARWSSE